MSNRNNYFFKIIEISLPCLEKLFSKDEIEEVLCRLDYLKDMADVKEKYQRQYKDSDDKLTDFLNSKDTNLKLIWGNCLDVLKSLKSESIHLMVTSPPYYNAREYSQWKDINDYLADMRQNSMNCYEHILIFHKHRDDLTKYPCPVCGTLKVNGNAMSELGLRSWECKNLECFERSKANRGKRFSLKTIMTQGRQENIFEIDADFIKKWRRDIIKLTPVIKINCKGDNILGHTAPFPTEIPEFAIKMFSYPNEHVLDPFGGSFTSAIEAKKLGRIGIGIELNKEMFREADIKNVLNNFASNVLYLDEIHFSEIDYFKDKKKVLNRGIKYDYQCFNGVFYNNFEILENKD